MDGYHEHEKIYLIMLIQRGMQPKSKGGRLSPTHLSTCRMIYQILIIFCLSLTHGTIRKTRRQWTGCCSLFIFKISISSFRASQQEWFYAEIANAIYCVVAWYQTEQHQPVFSGERRNYMFICWCCCTRELLSSWPPEVMNVYFSLKYFLFWLAINIIPDYLIFHDQLTLTEFRRILDYTITDGGHSVQLVLQVEYWWISSTW